MTSDELTEIQEGVNAGKVLSLEECTALIGEVWRLKTVLASKTIEMDYWRASCDERNDQLSAANEAHSRLRQEIELLKELNGMPSCALENRWSNCAVRIKKRKHKKE